MIDLPPHLRSLLDADIPRFSSGEMMRRRDMVAAAMAEAGAEHLVFCGYNRAGSAVQWLTHWPVTNEALGVFTPGLPDALFVQYVNHAPLARRFAEAAETVEWGGESSIRKVIETLAKRGAKSGRVAVIGQMPFEQHGPLAEKFGKIVSMNRVYQRLRAVKSAEELDWLRVGAAMSDAGMAALRDAIKPGVTERQLGGGIERAYVPEGGATNIHYIATPSRRESRIGGPRQYRSTRNVRNGDVVVSEITALFFDHGGQVLRSFTGGEEPTPLYRDLHAAADAALDAIFKVLK